MTYEEKVKQLERILTIDGKGRPWKAQELKKLLNSEQLGEIIVVLEEIEQRKFL